MTDIEYDIYVRWWTYRKAGEVLTLEEIAELLGKDYAQVSKAITKGIRERPDVPGYTIEIDSLEDNRVNSEFDLHKRINEQTKNKKI